MLVMVSDAAFAADVDPTSREITERLIELMEQGVARLVRPHYLSNPPIATCRGVSTWQGGSKMRMEKRHPT
jgi:hypothetical protein